MVRSNLVIVTNAVRRLVVDGVNLVSESCSNGAVEPGEVVALNFSLRNAGTASTSNLVATLLPIGGIWSPSGPQTFGSLSPGATASRLFSFVSTGSCGHTNTATLQLQDGAISLGTASFNLVLGQAGQIFVQNFDNVTAPVLPPGWSTSTSGQGIAWVTSTALVDSGPNSIFCGSAPTAGVSDLVSPVISIPPGAAQLSFQHLYGFENGYDGGILEIKIGNG